jgi:hypothetical protein
VIGPHSGDGRDLRQGRGERVRSRAAAAAPEAHLDLEPVPAGRYGVTEVLAGAGGSVRSDLRPARDEHMHRGTEAMDAFLSGKPVPSVTYTPVVEYMGS